MSYIDIKVIIDPSLLLQNYPDHSDDKSTPTAIKQDEAFMVAAPSQNVFQGNATGILKLKVQKNEIMGQSDEIRWRICSSVKNDYFAILYKIDYLPPKTSSPDSTFINFATSYPVITVVSRSGPLPNYDDPTIYNKDDKGKDKPYNYIDTYWYCNVKEYRLQKYELCFYIVQQDDSGKLNLAGYYSWQATVVLLKKNHG